MSIREINKTVLVPKSCEHCFELWTTETGIKQFFAPNCRVELRLGGAFEMYFLLDAAPGGQGSEGCKVLSYIPNEMFSFSWNAPPQFPAIRAGDHHTWVVITFKAIEKNQTEVRLRHLGWLETGRWNEVFDYFNAAWTRVLDSFKKACVEDTH